MSGGIPKDTQGMQQLYYDPKANQYMVQKPTGHQLVSGVMNTAFVPFKGAGLPNLNTTYTAPQNNFTPSQLLQSQIAGAQAMFNSPLAVPTTRNAPKPTIRGTK